VDASQKTCMICAESAPETATEYTLIGQKYAWRLERHTDERGMFSLVWYCPGCWRKLKEQRRTGGR
jgi:hypothetical protein